MEAQTRLSRALGDRYLIEREIGEGGMATVYLAHDLKHDRKVALKVLKPELAAVVGSERFLAEIKTTANLQHPHILPLFDSGESDGFLFFVMPYVEGESLRERLDREGELPVEEAVRIATAVASALDYAHRHGVIHRDIKPANILLHDGQPLVADFGIALAVSAAGGGRLTETGLSLGTPYYMSPEQATGERDPDARSDVYALGCVLYEMLVGEPPYTGASAQAVLGKILTTDPVRLTEHRKAIPAHVEAAVLKALEKRPADRFGNASELVGALGDAGFRMPRDRDGDRIGVSPKWKSAAVASAIAALLFAVIAIWRLVQGGIGPATPQYLPLALRDPPRAFFAWSSSVELAPEGNRIAYIGHDRWWWSLDLGSGGSRSIPLGVQGNSVTFSPSGDSLAHTSSAWLQQLYVVDLATGGRTLLADSVGGHISWGADGWIYYTHNGLYRVRISDGIRETLAIPGPGEAWNPRNPSPVPGGGGVLYTRVPKSPGTPDDAEVFALDLRTGESSPLARGIEAVATSSGHILIAQFDGGLLAARFSADDLEIQGRPVPVLEGLEVRDVGGTGGSFNVTEDGSLLFVEARPLSEDTVVIVGRDGMVRSVIPGWEGVFYNPSALAYDEAADRWIGALHRGLAASHVYLRDGGLTEPRPITFQGTLNIYPRFIPGTGDLAFVSTREGRNWDLYRVPSGASGSEVLILDRMGDIREPRFSSDGRWVVFCETSLRGERDVVAHRLAPDTLTNLLAATDAEECFPDISPDGKWLAYTSDETGKAEVWVRPFDENTETRWKVSMDGGSSPRWSKSGRELFFVDPENEVVAVPIRGGEVFKYDPPKVLFSVGERSSWTGDTRAQDQEFILIRTRLEAPGQVVLIRNFFELLREKVG